MKQILIVEDDEKLRNELKIFLENNGYECNLLTTFQDPINDILKINPDLLLLDINLPNTDGQYICREIRKKSDLPIIIITSRNNETDELISLNCGADNYVTKPFNIHILLARISNLLKRVGKGDGSDNTADTKFFKLNIAERTIESNGKVIELTRNEFKILCFMIQNKNRIISREEIMQYMWENENFVDDNTLTVNITRLRKKIGELGQNDLIRTRRGQGYIFKEK